MYDLRSFAPLYAPNAGTGAGTLEASVTVSGIATAATSAALPGNAGANGLNQIRISNISTVWAYVNFGRSTGEIPAATVASSLPIPPTIVVIITVPSEVAAVSVILASSTGNVIFTRGAGTN